MRHREATIVTTAIIGMLLAPTCSVRGQTAGESSDEALIRASAAGFREAFDRGDAKALAALWTEDGEIIEQSGVMLRGREAIASGYGKFFAEHQGATIEIEIQSISFPGRDIAMESGTTKTVIPGVESPVRGHYTATHLKKDGRWLIRIVHESPPLPPSNYEHLKELEWLIGTWIDDTRDWSQEEREQRPIVYTTCRWTVNRNFLVRNFTATVNGQVATTGTQYIGWYAPTKQIRSWSFDSKGHVIAGIWTKAGDEWTVTIHEALANGRTEATTERLHRQDDHTQIWRFTERSASGAEPSERTLIVRRHH